MEQKKIDHKRKKSVCLMYCETRPESFREANLHTCLSFDLKLSAIKTQTKKKTNFEKKEEKRAWSLIVRDGQE